MLCERLLPGLGVDLFLRQTASYFSRNGMEVKIFACTMDAGFSQFGVPVQILPIRFTRKLPLYHRQMFSCLSELRSYQPDVWLIATEPFYPLTRMLSPSLVFFFGNSPPAGTSWKGWANFAYSWLEQNVYSFPASEKIVVISSFIRNQLPFWLRKKSVVIYPGADHYGERTISPKQILEEKARLGIAPEKKVCLYAGRLNPHYQPYKGTEELGKLAQEWQQAKKPFILLMVGYGDEQDEEWAKSQGAFVRRMVPFEDMSLYFQMCDLYISASKWEGLNLPVVEAGYFGKPSVLYDVGAHREVVIHQQTGLLIPPSRAGFSRFSQAVEYLLEHSEKREEMGKKAKEFCSRFRWEYSQEQILSLITSITG